MTDAHRCRSCRATAGEVVLDLGDQPASDHFPLADDPGPDPAYPLQMWLCARCRLAQLLADPTTPEEPRGAEPAALVEQHRRRHARQRALAAFDAIRNGSAARHGHVIEIRELVVQDEAADHLARAEGVFHGRRHRQAGAVAVITQPSLAATLDAVVAEVPAVRFTLVTGEQYDPCYHLGCDDIDNLSRTALDQMSDAAAHATLALIDSQEPQNRDVALHVVGAATS